jgi:hypothetical protein
VPCDCPSYRQHSGKVKGGFFGESHARVHEIFDVDPTIEAGGLLPVNGAKQGASVDPSGAPYPAVNDGTFSGHSRIVSLGVTVRFDELVGTRRPDARE